MKKITCLISIVTASMCMNAQTNVNFKRLVSFDGTNGAKPFAGLIIGKDGNLYGTTVSGGVYNNGTIFKMSPNGTISTLFSFNGTNGFFPSSELVQGADGKLYGSTSHGGNGYDNLHSGGAGTIFKISTDGRDFTNLYFFGGMGEPVGGLVLATDGNFYGTTQWGGTGNVGTIFRISPEGDFKTLASLGISFSCPDSGLVLGRDSNMYGTMAVGGKTGGSIFQTNHQWSSNNLGFFYSYELLSHFTK